MSTEGRGLEKITLAGYRRVCAANGDLARARPGLAWPSAAGWIGWANYPEKQTMWRQATAACWPGFWPTT